MKYYLTPFLLLVISLANGQEWVSFNITQQNGLPSNTVYDIFQDSQGFLWVATENGLARYNGVDFRVYENQKVRSLAISNLSEDTKGRIWLHNFFGEVLFVENSTLQKVDSWDQFYKSGFPSITNFNDTTVINTGDKVFFYLKRSTQWVRIDTVFESHSSPMNHINYEHHKLINNTIWLCYYKNSKLVVRALDDNYSIKYELENATTTTLHLNAFRLVDFHGTMGLFNVVTKQLFLLRQGIFQEVTHLYKNVLKNTRDIKKVSGEEMAFMGTEGCHLLDRDNNWKLLAAGKNVSSIVKDKEDGYWLATLNEGLFYVPSLATSIYDKNKHNIFLKLVNDTKSKRIMGGAYDGSIGLFSYDGVWQGVIPSFYPKEIQSLFVDTQADKLMYFGKELYTFQLSNLSFQSSLGLASVKDVIKIGDDYGFATSSGFYFMDHATNKLSNLYPSIRISSAAYDPSMQTIWLGTQKGAVTYNLVNGEFSDWFPDSDNSKYSPGISKAIINGNYLVFGTYTDGLYILKGSKVFRHFTEKDGLPSNRITALATHQGYIWVGTDQGVMALEVESGRQLFIDDSKGLAGKEIYDLTFAEDKLWVSHANGLQYFTAIPQANEQKPIIHVSKVSSDDSIMTNYLSGVVLQPNMRQLTINFDVSNNLKSRGKTKIYYRVKELNENWSQTSLYSPSANYLSLPSGNYTFEAYAENEDDIASVNQIVIPLTVIAPFWERPWFLVSVFIFGIVIFTVLIFYRFKRINERNRHKMLLENQEQELRIAQLTSIRAQLNPHFIFNTMSLIQGKVLSGLKDEANKAIQDFSMLMRKVLDFSSREIITLQEEIEVLEKYLAIEKSRFNDTLTFAITMDEELKNEIIKLPSLLTQPYVENSLRHGLLHRDGLKKLDIGFHLHHDVLIIKIEDNGIGRKASAEFNKARRQGHKSFALGAYSRRIDLLNASRKHAIVLEIIDHNNAHGIATGTSVIIKIPLDNESIN